tara:strand:- start:308 stop:637 length:330 start_codon:yes stop_codon:yes gene_type:complete
MIDVTFQALFQVRFETLAFHAPSFTKVSDKPLEYDFQGGMIGILQTYPAEDYRHSVQVKCVINEKHYVYIGGNWTKVSQQSQYELQNYDLIWFSSAPSNNLKITEVNYV